MPSVRSLAKVQKTIKGSVHPKGRKFIKLNRAHLRETKLEHKKIQHLEKRHHELKRVLFFQELLEEKDKKQYSVAEMREFVEQYIARHDEELQQLRSQRRSNRPMSKRQESLEINLEKENEEYKTGFQIPNMTDAENVERLLKWNGTIGGVNNVEFCRVTKDSDKILAA